MPVLAGVPGYPTGAADIQPPLTSQCEVPKRGCLNGEGQEGCRWQLKTLGTKPARTHAHTLTGTMDAKPKILMPTVVAHWKPREGCAAVCVWGVLTDYPHTPAASQEGGCQRISDPRLSSFSPRCHPRCYYVCILVIHTGSLTLLAQVNTYTHADTQAQAHTPFCHTSGAWMPGREREREMYSFTFYCARIEC